MSDKPNCYYCKEPITEGCFKVIKEGIGVVDAHRVCHQNSTRPKSSLRIKIRPGKGVPGGLANPRARRPRRGQRFKR